MARVFNLPLDIVLVRHGESEGNLAQKRSKMGDQSDWTPTFKNRHTCDYRLTDKGRLQAKLAGDYLKEHFNPFDKFFVSEYARAMETAALLDLPNAHWVCDFYLRERDKGVLGGHSYKDRSKKFADELNRRYKDSFYWAPPGGESIANSCIRVDRILSQLQETCSGFSVILVCHGNIMTAFRIRLERMKQADFRSTIDDPKETIYNCQIIHYSRRDPWTGEVHPEMNWMRSICPWDLSMSTNEWKRIIRPVWTNEQLLEAVRPIPQLVNNKPEDIELKEQPRAKRKKEPFLLEEEPEEEEFFQESLELNPNGDIVDDDKDIIIEDKAENESI